MSDGNDGITVAGPPTGPTAGPPIANRVLQRFDTSLRSPAGAMSVHEIRAEMRLVRSVQAMAAARLLELNHRLHALASCPETPVAVDPHRELRAHVGLRGREARALDTQATATAAAPALGDLLAAGVTTPAHVESVGLALRSVGDGRDALLGHVDEVVRRAATMSVDDFDRFMKRMARDAQADDGLSRFERQRRSTRLRVWNDVDGMVNLSGAFDPERGAALLGVLDHRVEAMFHSGDREIPFDVAPGIDANDHRRALALLALCSGDGRGGADGARECVDARPARAEVVVHVDLETLQRGLHVAGVCRTSHGGDIPPDTARRLACDAEIVPVVLGRESVPLDVGRSHRLATVHQRRALESTHDTCAIDGCEVAFGRCTIHHIVPWEHGGATDLENLVPLCTRHHHAVHEGGWTIRLAAGTRKVECTLPGQSPDTDPHAVGDDLGPAPP